MSLGYDARVGFGFEKKRSGNRLCNKCIYLWEGIKKNCCRKTIHLESFIESFKVIKFEENKPTESFENQTVREDNGKAETIFKSKDSVKLDILNNIHNPNYKKELQCNNIPLTLDDNIVLKGDPVSLICQNIPFYMAGARDIWRKSGSNLGLEIMDGNVDRHKDVVLERSKLKDSLISAVQKYNDQKLEFFTYSSGMKLGFEKISGGLADKIYHGSGPMIITFKDTPERVN